MSDMLVKLYNLPEIESLIKKHKDQGIIIRTAMPSEKLDVVEWVNKTFGRGWASECDTAFSRIPVSCFIATENSSIIGFACHDSTCKNFFGPTGIAKKKQGLKIGKALLLSCLYAMAANGYAYAIIGDAASADYYKKSVNAIPIKDSTPGIYQDQLKK